MSCNPEQVECAGVSRKSGQILIEYAFVLLLIAVVVLLMVSGVGDRANSMYSGINSGFSSAAAK